MIKASIRNVASRILRHYPLYGGCRRIANSMPFLWLSEPLEVVATLRTGGKLMVRVDDFDGRAAFYFGDHDPKVTWVARQVIRPGDTVLDVGANWGIATAIFADLTGPGGCVHAFEPQLFLAEALARSVRLNGYPHVHVHPVGLSTEDAKVVMQVPKNHCGAGSVEALPPWASRDGVDHVSVELVGADAYLERLRLSRVRLMKIDVEGHEASVLSGAIRFFERTPPDVVVFEHKAGSAGFWAHPVVRYFAARGYALGVIPLRAKGMGTPWLQSIEPPAFVPGYDFVAVGPCEDRSALMSALGMLRH
jgi:FkbM family methyltransferase